jgi:long-chain fatty acid transport protein
MSSAGGLWLNEFGDFAGGRAAAGAAAGVDEAMTLAYNPASITRLEGSELFASGGAVLADMKFDVQYSHPRNGTGTGGDAGEPAVTSSMAYVHDLNSSKWSAAVGLVPLSGAGMEYTDNWAGRYQATKVDLLLMALAPTVAYQVTDHLSLGVTVQVYYADLNMHFNVPRPLPLLPDGKGSLNGDDVGTGFTLGAMYELSDRTRFGFNYQSELQPKFNGDFKVNPSSLQDGVATDTELKLAEYLRAGMHHDLDEHWSIDFTIGWDNWSKLDNVLVSTEDGSAGIPTKWGDTYHYAWGAQYRPGQRWAFTAGVAYDTNPVDAKYRNAQLPVDRQVRYALGARYALRDSLILGGYINYADLGRARISGQRFGGEYKDNNALQLIANVSWKF